MKKIFAIIATLALAASCSTSEDVNYSTSRVLKGYCSIESRTQFETPTQNQIPFSWSAGDYIWVGTVHSNPIAEACKSANFDFGANTPSVVGNYDVFYNMTGTDKTAKVLAEQTADGNLGNDGDFGYAVADEFDTFVLEHKVAYIWFDTTSEDITERLVSIKVTAEEGFALAGERVFNFESKEWAEDVTDASNSITLKFGEGVVLSEANEGVFAAMVTYPAEVEGTELTVVYTFADGKTFTEVKTPSKGFAVGAARRIATNIAAEDLVAPAPQYQLRTLTFEGDYWVSMIDSVQYGGDLLYSDGMEYSWVDSNNTNLSHSFTTPYWTGGHAISNYVIEDYSTLPDGYDGWYALQLATPIGGNGGSANFCVHNGYKDFFNEQLYDATLQGFEFADGVERVIDHMYITNTCYVLNSLTYGDGFAPAATEETLFKVIAYGYDAEDSLTGSCEFVLCQGTDIVTDWQKWELSALGKVAKVVFNFVPSSDLVGDYGMNTPAYFAYDDVAVRFEE